MTLQHFLVRTITEEFYYDPYELAEQHDVLGEDALIELFELHEGSFYGDKLFTDLGNGPSVGIEFVTREDDE